MTNKLSEARRRANQKWDEKNKDRKKYIVQRSTARNFIKKMEDSDIPEFKELLKNRIEKGKE